MFNELPINKTEGDEYMTKGLCSISPTLSSLHEVVLIHLKELSFYLLKLKDFGVTNEEAKHLILDALMGILIDAEYNQDDFSKIILELDKDIEQSKFIYKKFCEEKSLDAESLKLYFKHSKDFNLTEAIKKGEKYFLKKTSTLTSKQKDLYEIMLFLIKSMCLKIIEYKRLGKENDEYYYSALSMLNVMNISDFTEENAIEEIKNFIKIYYDAVVDVYYAQQEIYGEVEQVDVSFSTTPGKAILVSGSDYKKLELVLKAAEGKGIDVYTHGLDLLMAHTHPKLREHPNLKGHFGSGLDSALIDFSEFPGAILMTKATLIRTEYLYRGRLYTLDPIAPSGVMKIKNLDFEPLIKSATDAKGFEQGQKKPSITVGYSEKEIKEKVEEIADKILNKKIKNLYIVGLFNYSNVCLKYFENFFKLLPKDGFAISLSCTQNRENVYYLDSFYDYSFLYKVIKHLKAKIPLNEINLSIFVTRCDKHIIANLIYLKEIGIKNIFMCKCPPTLVNPALMSTLLETFDIKEASDPRRDLEETLKK